MESVQSCGQVPVESDLALFSSVCSRTECCTNFSLAPLQYYKHFGVSLNGPPDERLAAVKTTFGGTPLAVLFETDVCAGILEQDAFEKSYFDRT